MSGGRGGEWRIGREGTVACSEFHPLSLDSRGAMGRGIAVDWRAVSGFV